MKPGSVQATKPVRRQSLRWRLPLLMSALVAVAVAVFLLFAYRTVEATLIREGARRAEGGAEEIAGRLSAGMAATGTQARRLEGNPHLKRFLSNPTPETREAARFALLPADAPPAFRRWEVWSADGALLLEIVSDRPANTPSLRAFPRGSAPKRIGISELAAAGDFPYFEITSAVHDDSSGSPVLIGYFRRFGELTATGPIKRLLGEGADLKIGSAAGVWTDFTKVVAPPPAADSERWPGEYVSPEAEGWVGALGDVKGTPWKVWVGYPRDRIVAPARSFLLRMLLIGGVVIGLTALLASLLARRITRPLAALSGGAAELAAGDYSKRVTVRRRDEIGHLADTFNAMAGQLARNAEVHETAEAALRASHASFRQLFANNPLPMWVYHAETLRFLEVNDAAIAHYGYTRDEFLAMSIEDIRPAEDVPRLRESIAVERQALQQTTGWRHKLKSGQVIDVEVASHALTHGGQPAVLVVALDVTERKRLEKQILQSQKMDAIGQLTGGIAHDFNNVLTGILGYCELLRDALPREDPRQADVQEIEKGARSAAGLTARLLAFSRKQIVSPRVLDMNAVVSDLGRMLERVLGEDIALALQLAPDLGHIKADPVQVEQVIMNLAVNARDAMPTGGNLTIETANVVLDQSFARTHFDTPPGPYVMLAVSDTGKGMAADVQAHVFEPFFTTKEVGKGTGLGLSTVYGIVKQSGGSIWIYSEPGQGATFKVYFPRVDEALTTTRERPRAVAVDRPATILVAEDSPALGALVRRILERRKYTVLSADSAAEARRLAAAHRGNIDLLLSDVVMPEVSGPVLASELRALHPEMRILHMSGYTEDAVIRHGIIEGTTAFIQKPFTPEGLLEKIREVLAE